ncbi:MAG: class F sortase, partial [Dehalococcoidia bacterium]
KDDVGCYALDGYDGSNLVLGGHVDWFTHEPGVFWDLRTLQPGDEAQVVLRDGSSVRFRVTTSQVYDATTPAVAEIVGNTPVPTLTLITCDGEFNLVSGEYNKSRIVRAEKID